MEPDGLRLAEIDPPLLRITPAVFPDRFDGIQKVPLGAFSRAAGRHVVREQELCVLHHCLQIRAGQSPRRLS